MATLFTFRSWRTNGLWVCIMFLLSGYLTAATLVALTSPILPVGYDHRGLLAGLDNALEAVALGAIVASSLTVLTAIRALRTIVLTFSVALIVNTGLAVLQMRGLATFGSFWTGGDIGEANGSVAANGMANFRFAGLINQAAEAGALYGLVLMALFLLPIFTLRERLLLSPPLLVGGYLPGSKVFLAAIGITLMASLLERSPKAVSGRRSWTLVVFVAGLIAATWGGDITKSLWRRLSNQGSILDNLSAGRYGGGGEVSDNLRLVLESSPLGGFGIGGLGGLPYDSQLLEVLATLGLFGVGLWLAIWLLLFIGSWTRPQKPLRPFARSMVLLLAVASFGFSPLTANRVAVLAWLLIHTLVLSSVVMGMRVRARSPLVKERFEVAEG